MSQSTTTEFKNDRLAVEVSKEQPGCRVKLAVTISPEANQNAYEKAMKNVTKEVSMPGFRKGKAPKDMIISKYKNAIQEEWRSVLIDLAFSEALELSGVYPYRQNTIKKPIINASSPDQEANITFEFEHFPEVPDIDVSELKIEPINPNGITDKNVDELVEDLQLHHTQWEEITDRGIEEGDFVDLDIFKIPEAGSNEKEEEICRDTIFEVKEGKMGGWMRKLLEGHHVNDSVEGISEKEEKNEDECGPSCTHEGHHHEEDDTFVPTHCRIVVKSLKKANLPVFDDELAQKAGVSTKDELLSRMRQRLENQEHQRVQSQMRDEMRKILAEKYAFDLPQTLLKDGEEEAQTYRMTFLLSKLAGKYQLNPTEMDIAREAMMLNMYPGAKDMFRDQEQLVEHVAYKLKEKIALDYLVERAKTA